MCGELDLADALGLRFIIRSGDVVPWVGDNELAGARLSGGGMLEICRRVDVGEDGAVGDEWVDGEEGGEDEEIDTVVVGVIDLSGGEMVRAIPLCVC